jgi:hypothetical protein
MFSMFPNIGFAVKAKPFLLAVVLLACPLTVFAQHGGRGAGGSAAGSPVEGIDSMGRPTGVSEGDDLKDFHAALAVQASSQQIIEYAAMLKSTAAAAAEVQAFQTNLAQPKDTSHPAGVSASLVQAVENARTSSSKFLDGFSLAQKNGLREIIKRLSKADSELAQQLKELDQLASVGNSANEAISNAAAGLERSLANFRSQQLDLGEEMGIEDPDGSQAFTFDLPAVKNSVSFANQTVVISTSGVISKSVAENDQNSFSLQLMADMSDLQQNITEVLRTQLDQENRCGDHVEVQDAALTPLGISSRVVAQIHFERWACFGSSMPNEMFEGNGSIDVKLTPAVSDDGALRLAAEIERIDADGLIGDQLRAGSLGEVMRDKIRDSLLAAARRACDFKALLPSTAQSSATLRRAGFQGTGSGRLMFVINGDIRLSHDQAASLSGQLKQRSPAVQTSQENVPR